MFRHFLPKFTFPIPAFRVFSQLILASILSLFPQLYLSLFALSNLVATGFMIARARTVVRAWWRAYFERPFYHGNTDLPSQTPPSPTPVLILSHSVSLRIRFHTHFERKKEKKDRKKEKKKEKKRKEKKEKCVWVTNGPKYGRLNQFLFMRRHIHDRCRRRHRRCSRR